MLSSPPFENDPIAGLATAPGNAGVAVIRLSGPGLPGIVLPLLRRVDGAAATEALLPPRRLQRLDIFDGADGAVLDQVLVVCFPAPHSFTGEDQVEIHCHGAPVVVARIFHLLNGLGVRIARPGEFSRRAFLNGKMDLTRAEALMSLIHAATLRGARQAMRQMEGVLHQRIATVRESLLMVLAHLEASLDFSDEEIEPDEGDRLLENLAAERRLLSSLIDSARLGDHLREGFELAIIGRPNVGKSSLFNRLLGEKKAIVTAIPGTTRDLIEHHLEIDGIPVRLVDTAGLRTSEEPVEREGIRLAEQRLERADGVLLVCELPHGLLPEERRLAERAGPERLIMVWNKKDLSPSDAPLPEHPWPQTPALALSCKNGDGLETLKRTIARRFGAQPREGDGMVIMVARQREALTRALVHLQECERLMNARSPGEIIAIPLGEALSALGELVGTGGHDELLDRIFSSFCIGK